MATEMNVITVERHGYDDDSDREGDPFLDRKGKGRICKKAMEVDDAAMRAEKERQEKLDADLAASLHEQSVKEYQKYKQRQACIPQSNSSTMPGTAGDAFDIHDFLRQEQRQLAAAGHLLLYPILRSSHTVVLILLPLSMAELLLIVIAPILSMMVFQPLEKAMYVWIPVGHSVKCILGCFIGIILVLIQRSHLPSQLPPKAAGILRNDGFFFQIAANLDLAIIMLFTFMLASVCLNVIALTLCLWSWTANATNDMKQRLAFVLLVCSFCITLQLFQLAIVRPLYILLRMWPTLFRPEEASAPAALFPVTSVSLPTSSSSLSTGSPSPPIP